MAASNRARLTAAFAVALGLVVAALAVAWVLRFVAQERDRDITGWQIRLGIVADSRKAAIDAWLAAQRRDLDAVAGNDSVRLFMTELKLASGEVKNVADGQSQQQYIGNLLVFTASQSGFAAAIADPNLPVNIARADTAGLAVFDLSGRLLVATRGMPSGEPWVGPFLTGAAKAKTALRDIWLNAAGNPAMGFLVPIFTVQGDATPEEQVGWVLGVKQIGPELFPLLRQPGDTSQTADALLVRGGDGNVEYLSPLPEYKPLALALSTATPGLAESAALGPPSGFGLAHDYRGVDVLYASRHIAGAPWVLVYKIDRAEALGASDQRAARLLGILILALLLVAAMLAAAWRHGASRRATLAAERYRELAARFERQTNLLRLVTDGQPNAIFIVDDDGRYSFANRRAAAEAGIAADEMLGKTVAAVLGPAKAARYLELNRRAAENGDVLEDLSRSGEGASLSVLHTQHIPLATPPDDGRGVLVIEEDLSQLTAEQERRRATLDHLANCLIALADRRDPAAAGHSAFVSTVARAVAEEMALEPALVESADMAGRLMNLGKILVPRSILTRAGPLTPAELDQLHDSLIEATRFLDGVAFDGPVIETLRQCQEHWDGNGRPGMLQGRAIIPTARVLAVANAFVGLLSPRAYHATRRTMDEVIAILVGEIGSKFDPAVVAALINRIENKGARADWITLAARPVEASAEIDPA
ncbi:MAG TPA: HD domain-containing phosphohydrolase [Stellaceae bacterium]|nr:HD domain-containing phosphohydrolase [Stellaceae bacterium]